MDENTDQDKHQAIKQLIAKVRDVFSEMVPRDLECSIFGSLYIEALLNRYSFEEAQDCLKEMCRQLSKAPDDVKKMFEERRQELEREMDES